MLKKSTTGKKTIKIGCSLWDYAGDLDQNELANGNGVAISQEKPEYKFEGTFLDDQLHGIGKS